jgi:DNA-binding transcriptional regulator YdaS (Cro superfamily)
MTNTLTRFEALKQAVENAKTQASFAAALDVTQPAVSQWLSQSKQLPAEHVLIVERLFGVSRHDLRPDYYPRPIPNKEMVDHGGPDRFYGVERAA